ncbi:hypothetical protein EBB59_07765 [Lysobacter pythonis]|uniref:Protein SirB1 N-terminal domain-containing protein n=1 Tax=Solilutibacter pythonis TaxID=2483112 RepID=A0A3M2HZK7_9GAMM|nr:transglutaminase family protein [Lysobacter pythonis]RMH92849.1 hypothetical protein EBB59_07765 [Lysobacter pythonis]
MRFWLIILLCTGLSVTCPDALAANTGKQRANQPMPPKPAQDPALGPIRALVATPENQVDLARAKLAIDQFIDSTIDVPGTLRRLDALAAGVKARFPANANDAVKMELLLASLGQPGPWNDYRPFSYDLDDPSGKIIRNKLLSTYLDTRKGNCVSMPILLVILGQKLDLNLTLATAPQHVLAKFHNPYDGKWVNVEATSGGFKLDSSYQHDMGITPRAMANGIYLRPLSKRESLGVMLSTLMESYRDKRKYTKQIEVADMALKLDPKDTAAMLQKGSAHYLIMKTNYMDRYPSQAAIPPEKQAEFAILARANILWFQKAEALGWAQPTTRQDTTYQQVIQRTKEAQQGARP